LRLPGRDRRAVGQLPGVAHRLRQPHLQLLRPLTPVPSPTCAGRGDRGEGNRARRAAMETLTRRLDRAEEYLRRRMAEQHIPALALTVVEQGEILRAEAYGVANLEWDAPATPDTTFQLASATKLLTATLLMLLVEEGAIGLDVPIPEYLRQAPPHWGTITIRHLASHTSGVPDEVGPVSSVEAAVEAAARLPLEYAPG